jgi:hypothetical protein
MTNLKILCQVHQLLPEICVAVMNSIIALYSNQSGDSPVVPVLKEAAKALALYTATVPYRFPLSVNSVLLQLQSKII